MRLLDAFPGLILGFLLDVRNQLVDPLVERLVAGRTVSLVSKDSLAVEDIESRPVLDVPSLGDWAGCAATVPPTAPGKAFSHDRLLQLLAIAVAVDAE